MTPVAPVERGTDTLASPIRHRLQALVETVEQLMDGLDEPQQEMFSLRLQGYTIPEISQQTARSERTVERLLERIRHRILRIEAPEGP